ncbi:MAG: peroxiredoxin [Vulcanimicrobiota bacterium]
MKKVILLVLLLTVAALAASDLKVGDSAPTPEAVDQDGKPVELAKLYQEGIVLVYFYPKADTPGCTAQACSLRDAYTDLSEAGLTVIGVSTDKAEAQKAFKAKYKLPFRLIPDPGQTVLRAFGVPTLVGVANREAFLIKDGKVVWHDSHASTKKQAQDVLAELKRL